MKNVYGHLEFPVTEYDLKSAIFIPIFKNSHGKKLNDEMILCSKDNKVGNETVKTAK